jgi:medium-chain acyl-[acyl-carrier-protein] hydrolase
MFLGRGTAQDAHELRRATALHGRAPSDPGLSYLGLGSNPAARARVLCFPFAGGGASVYRDWRSVQEDELEVVAAALPGRERHIATPPARRLGPLVERLAVTIPGDKPFALFGHSMGALISYELARQLEAEGRGPVALFVSAFRAPHLPSRTAPKHGLPDEALVRELEEMGGTSPELLRNVEFRQMLLNLLRGDLELIETYTYEPGPPLTCPIIAFGGYDDTSVPGCDLEEWDRHTDGRFRLQMFSGGHMYVSGEVRGLMGAIRAEMFDATSHSKLKAARDLTEEPIT